MSLERNPSCACGCGLEVRLPTNHYVHGHVNSRKMGPNEIQQAIGMLKAGKSQAWIGAQFGVSQARISALTWEFRHPDFVPIFPVTKTDWSSLRPIRQAELDQRNQEWEEERLWRTAKRKHKEVKQYLNRFRRRTVA